MSTNVTLITFRSCPNADKARLALKNIGVSFTDVISDELPANHLWRRYSSPSILQDEKLVFGSDQGGDGACSLKVPTENELKERLITNETDSTLRNGKSAPWLSFFGSVGSVVTVGLCPVCIPAIGALFSAMGVGFFAQEAVLKPFLILLLTLTVAGLGWSWIKEHRNPTAFLAGILFAITLYAGRYVYFGGGVNEIVEFIGMAGLIVATAWNLKLRRQKSCPSCPVTPQKG